MLSFPPRSSSCRTSSTGASRSGGPSSSAKSRRLPPPSDLERPQRRTQVREALASPLDAVVRLRVFDVGLARQVLLRALAQELGVVVPRDLLVHVERMHAFKTRWERDFSPRLRSARRVD